MPVARSVSATQLAREGSATSPGTPDGDGPALLTQKAHTLDRFSKPSTMNGHAEPRRKRSFMSFCLTKKPPKPKEGNALPLKNDVNQNPNGPLENSCVQTNVISEKWC